MGQVKSKTKSAYANDPGRQIKNKKAKQARHIKRLNKFLDRRVVRDELLTSALNILGITKSALRRLIGTLNVRRLRAVVENKYLNSQWFISREIRRQERKNDKLKHSKKPAQTTENNVQGIPEGRNTPDGNPQVDRK